MMRDRAPDRGGVGRPDGPDPLTECGRQDVVDDDGREQADQAA